MQNQEKLTYEQQEAQMSEESQALINILIKCGILGNPKISNERICVISQRKDRDSYVKTHPGINLPMGSLANHEPCTLQRIAHYYFYQYTFLRKIYKTGRMGRQESYRRPKCAYP